MLFDSSVWIDHFRKHSVFVADALKDNNVVMHEAVIGELALGNIPRKHTTLRDLNRLEYIKNPPFQELLDFVTRHKLNDRGLGWVDIQLMASAKLSNVELVTRDKILTQAWKAL